MNRTAENSRNCFNSFYSLYTGLCSEKKITKLVAHMLKKYLYSICLQIQADYVTFLFLPGVLKTGFPEVLSRIQLIAGNLSGHNLLKTVTFLG